MQFAVVCGKIGERGVAMNVLVVDDTTAIREFIKNVLVTQCRVSRSSIHEASDGKQAVLRYKDIKPNLVFMDISMPIMSGIDAVKEIVEFDADAKIVMCTATGDRNKVVSSLVSGALDYIVKPLSPHRIVESFEKLAEAIPTEGELNAIRKAAQAAAREADLKKAAIAESESGLSSQMAEREARNVAKSREEGLAHKILSGEKKSKK